MKMNKLFAGGMAVLTAFTLAACGSAGIEVGKTSSDSEGGAKEALTMVTSPDFAPWEFMDGNEIVGIDPEIGQAIADKMGVELKIESMDFDSLIPAVASGKADFVVSGFTVTDERKEQVDFTDAYTASIQKILVRKDSDIKSYEDLEGKTVGVEMGTTGAMDVEEDETIKMKADEYKTYSDVVTALKSEKIDAAVLDILPAQQIAEKNDDLQVLDDEPYGEEEYAIVCKKGSNLTAKLNDTLKALKEDGTIEKIMDKYTGAESAAVASQS